MNSSPSPVTTFERHGTIAVLVVNYPPVNALGQVVRQALADALATVAEDDTIAALVIRCDGRTYFAGADIREFGKPRTPPFLPELFEQVENCAKPVITAIHGSALGGGLELAMACHFRLAERSARLGLPEVTLGILPGAGGTQRLPRLIGTTAALDLLTSGRSISAAEALDLGLIDAIIDGDIAEQALAFAHTVVSEGRAIQRTRDRTAKLADVIADPAIIDRFEAENAPRFRHLDAPPAIFTAIRGILCADFDQGTAIERRLFLELREGPQAAALRYSFLAEREAAKLPGASAVARPPAIATIGVIGTGPFATDFATDLSNAGCQVTLVDEKSLLSQPASLEALSSADLIVEATDAPAEEKRDIFARLAQAAKPGALLATMTAIPDIDDIGASLERPEQFFGIHGLPPASAGLIEIVRGQQTGVTTLAAAMAFMKRIGKTAVVVGNTGDFIGTRMLKIMRREARAMVARGVRRDDIDRVADAFGMATAPIWIGDGTASDADPERAVEIDDAGILARLHYPLINEGARILEEGVAQRASDIDIVCLKAYGWPAWTGGPMFHGDRIGASALVGALERLNVRPAALLVSLADQQKSFADFSATAA